MTKVLILQWRRDPLFGWTDLSSNINRDLMSRMMATLKSAKPAIEFRIIEVLEERK